MRGNELLNELVGAAQRRGLAVRREAMTRGVSSGGLARVRGVATVFVDDRASVEAQIEVLSAVLRRFDWTGVELPGAVERALNRGAPGAPIPAEASASPERPSGAAPSRRTRGGRPRSAPARSS